MMSDDYEVGFKKPPVHSRFKPGNQAAKGGRKLKSKPRTIGVLLEELMTERHPVRRGDKVEHLPGAEMLKLRLGKYMKSDNPRETALFLGLLEKYAPSVFRSQSEILQLVHHRAEGSTVALPPADLWEGDPS
jgi:hypothetical protein